ncbi:ParB/Srx family N-terminal domain-containing protein [Shewanella sp.]|uniref:ParB/Srx family N-terminal domain-containing protein n=1 Tax=Shewanella sp. TaxID=50422 RepID=UPI0040478832
MAKQQIEQVSIEALIPYARNSRTHSDAQVAQIAASIKEFGFTNPVLIDEDGGIIAGHGRTLAARKLGLDKVPCLRLAYLSEAQKKAYIIADNRLALNAGWDDEMLKVEINELSDLNFDLSLLGFDDVELAKLFDEDEEEKDLKEESYSEVFNIIVECANESEQEKIFNRLDTEGYKCRVQSL